ncbi:MAG: NADH-quinone oxidoreductase subunit A [Acidobacteriota bacterium]|nr:NADH-quinone oxidoreductase subunit A [Acidobacteriota bacterium]MDQ7087636.1 NADH-quinone oxidoreductase subunit A [Acidobacteriota bacterium]
MDQTTIALLVLFAAAVATPAGMLTVSAIAGPARRRRRTDMTPYECGVQPFTSARGRFSLKFYLVAMLFIVFDIEAVFLYPWAVELKQQVLSGRGLFVFFEMMVFLGILIVGFIYVWGRGALEWDR